MKCFTCTIYSKERKRRTKTPCLTTETWRYLILNYFSAHISSLPFDLFCLTFAFYNWAARQAHRRPQRTSNVSSNVKRWMSQILADLTLLQLGSTPTQEILTLKLGRFSSASPKSNKSDNSSGISPMDRFSTSHVSSQSQTRVKLNRVFLRCCC